MNPYVYTARAMFDENQGEWIVRLIRWDHNMGEQNGSEYVGLCAAAAQGQPAPPKVKNFDLIHAMVESSPLSSQHITRRRYQVLPSPQGQVMIQEEILSQAWSHSPAPAAASPTGPSSSSPADAQPDGKKARAKPGRKSRPAKG